MCVCVFFFFFFRQKTAYEISACLVGSEMCIRGRFTDLLRKYEHENEITDIGPSVDHCLQQVKRAVPYTHLTLPTTYPV